MTQPPPTDPARTAVLPSSATEDDIYRVVVNDEEQYSIWPRETPVPAGWNDTGVHGTRADCLAHIDQVWTDLRPRSVRGHLDPGRGAGHGIGSPDW